MLSLLYPLLFFLSPDENIYLSFNEILSLTSSFLFSCKNVLFLFTCFLSLKFWSYLNLYFMSKYLISSSILLSIYSSFYLGSTLCLHFYVSSLKNFICSFQYLFIDFLEIYLFIPSIYDFVAASPLKPNVGIRTSSYSLPSTSIVFRVYSSAANTSMIGQY